MVGKKILVTIEDEVLKELDDYAKREYRGNRSMAVHRILKRFFADKEG